ncbi:hypothetical protein [Sutcliffiella horikoshii]|uniref:hypothetical protein n=1 Tax=Sutcliffiella horikoshii TaxID=79883 RepID=UPI001FD4F9D6|nr:hypothetical protein [Sutcliffiella horikoshii]
MAKSKAKKLRDKQVREGKRNPENGRGIYALANLTTKTTKTKKEKLNQLYKKERQSRYGGDRENVVLYLFSEKKCMKEFHSMLFPVDCSGRRADARGRKGQVRPRNEVRRLTDRPQASEAPGTEINRSSANLPYFLC